MFKGWKDSGVARSVRVVTLGLKVVPPGSKETNIEALAYSKSPSNGIAKKHIGTVKSCSQQEPSETRSNEGQDEDPEDSSTGNEEGEEGHQLKNRTRNPRPIL